MNLKTWKSLNNAQVLDLYQTHKSFDIIASIYGIARSTVHLRLHKIGYSNCHRKALLESDKQAIRELYNAGFSTGDGQLEVLCEKIGHTKQTVCRFARSEELTNRKRSGAKWRNPPKPPEPPKLYEHPRGMKGKKHTAEAKLKMALTHERLAKTIPHSVKSEQIIKGMKTKVDRYSSIAPKTENNTRSWNAGWRTVGGQRKYFRSKWEANYARVLEWRIEQGIISTWQHEPETFWFLEIKRGVRSYLPDFKVTYPDGRVEYHEVKGWMDDRSRVTLKRMAKYFPQIKVTVVDKDWFKANKNFRIVLKDWE